MSEIQKQLTVLFRKVGHLASRFTHCERQRSEEAANAAAMQAVQKAEEEGQKEREVQDEKKSGTPDCLPCTKSRELWRRGRLLLL